MNCADMFIKSKAKSEQEFGRQKIPERHTELNQLQLNVDLMSCRCESRGKLLNEKLFFVNTFTPPQHPNPTPVSLFCLIWFFTPQSTIFLLCWDGSSWVEPVLSKDICVLLKDQTQWCRWGSNPGPSVSSQALYHWATVVPPQCLNINIQ